MGTVSWGESGTWGRERGGGNTPRAPSFFLSFPWPGPPADPPPDSRSSSDNNSNDDDEDKDDSERRAESGVKGLGTRQRGRRGPNGGRLCVRRVPFCVPRISQTGGAPSPFLPSSLPSRHDGKGDGWGGGEGRASRACVSCSFMHTGMGKWEGFLWSGGQQKEGRRREGEESEGTERATTGWERGRVRILEDWRGGSCTVLGCMDASAPFSF